MITLRRLHNFLYLIPPLLAYTGCGSSDDSSSPSGGSGGVGGVVAMGGSAGKASGGSGGKAGSSATGGSAGSSTTAGASAGGEAGAGETTGAAGEAGAGPSGGTGGMIGTGNLNDDINTIVFIYAENRSFDGLFGNFPGAHGLSEVVNPDGTPKAAYVPQKDRDGTTVLPKLPITWGGATLAGNPTTVTAAQTDGLPNQPFGIENAFVANGAPPLTTADVTRDLTHKFFENQMEINGGTNDMFAAWLDAGGLTMGHWDYSQSSLYKLAQEYVLADNFFEGAFGGSFLNHQYLICACAPAVTAAWVASNAPTMNVLGPANAKGVPQLASNASQTASALDGPPSFKSGNIVPIDYFGTGDGYRAVNTMQPPYQPSFNTPAAAAIDLRYADPAKPNTLPPQTQMTIGDLLTAKSVTWAWYAGAWNAAIADGTQVSTAARTVIYAPINPRGAPDFQTHHQPFNYYAAFDPAAHAAERTAHLKDYNDLLTQTAAGTLPSVVFYKPTGNVNQHPGYANADDGDEHIAALVNRLKQGPQFSHMIIVITYDEYGGQWDHVAPPKGDLIGPGSRLPAIIISPFAKGGTVDHTQYDTASILRLITRRFALDTLPGLTARDTALTTAGGTKMGDFTGALNL